MLRAEVFTKSPGKLSVSWYDFSMAAFDLYTRYDLARDALEKRSRRRKRHKPGKLESLLNSIEPLCESLRDDNTRYEVFMVDFECDLFIQILGMSQLITEIAKEARVSVNLEFEDGDVEGCFDAWFAHHGKELDQ